MKFLVMLAEAVNAVAEWPQERCWASDSPQERCIGYQVGDQVWTCSLTELRRDLPEISSKRDQLMEMVKLLTLPLRPYPEHIREREILARACLLRAVHPQDVAERREAAKWVTFLGRLRADPSGRYLQGNPDEEPVPKPRPRMYLLHM
jgi:hypothetical protein